MAVWKGYARGDSLNWLLEEDAEQPGVRYFALRELQDYPLEADEVKKAQRVVMSTGPVPKFLSAQQPEGYRVKQGPGYGPKYQGTVWQVIFLAQPGASGTDSRVKKGCEYAIERNTVKSGGADRPGLCGR